MPSIGKNVSASYSSSPVSGRLCPRPGLSNQRASRAFITNQPGLAGTSPASVRSSSASPTTGGIIRVRRLAAIEVSDSLRELAALALKLDRKLLSALARRGDAVVEQRPLELEEIELHRLP